MPVSFFGIAYEVSVATTYWGTLPELYEVVQLALNGSVRARVQRFPLDGVAAAYAAMAAGELAGRALIVP